METTDLRSWVFLAAGSVLKLYIRLGFGRFVGDSYKVAAGWKGDRWTTTSSDIGQYR
jgi:hypothetical protein